MNAQLLDNEEHQTIDDLDWLYQKVNLVTHEEEDYFTSTVREVLARGWPPVYARHYALGRLMGVH